MYVCKSKKKINVEIDSRIKNNSSKPYLYFLRNFELSINFLT